MIYSNISVNGHRPIATENKGRQMLEKMGWKQGEGLGREGGGQKEPVSCDETVAVDESSWFSHGLLTNVSAALLVLKFREK